MHTIKNMSDTPKKILLLTTNYFPVIGGTEQECRNLARQFKKEGHQCRVLTSFREHLLPEEEIDGIPVSRKIRGWHFYEATYLLSVFFSLLKLRRQFDHIICFGLKRFTAPAVIFCRLFGKKIFFRAESPGSFDQTLCLRHGKLICRLSCLAHGAVVFTKETRDQLERNNFPKKKIFRIPNSVDTILFCPAEKKITAPIKFCFAGRLAKIKGLDTFIAALGRLRRETPDFKVLIIGDGDLKSELVKQAEQLGISGQVLFTGDTERVSDYYKQSDIFVLPSLSEGMPLALLEAMACGLCCIGSDTGGIQELMGPAVDSTPALPYKICENGLLFPPGDADALLQALLKVIADPDLRQKLSARARRQVLDNHAVSVTANQYLALLDKNSRAAL